MMRDDVALHVRRTGVDAARQRVADVALERYSVMYP